MRAALPALLLLLALCGGCMGGGSADPYSKRYTASDINPNPRILNSAIVKGTNLSNLRLENIVVKDATFFNTTATGATFKNVVFDNCRFINAVFDGIRMENVIMKGGLVTCETDPYNLEKQTRFTNGAFINLVLDGISLENAVFEGANGSITLKNAKNLIATHPFFTGTNMRLTFDNCLFKNMTIAEVTGKSTLTATNCLFQYAFFGESTFTRTTFRNNTSLGGPQYGPPPGARPRRR